MTVPNAIAREENSTFGLSNELFVSAGKNLVHQNLTRQNPKHFLWIRYSRILNPSNKNNTEIKGYCLLCYLLGLPVLLVLSPSSIRCFWVPFSLTASDIEAVYATSQRKSTTLMPQLHRPISLYKIYKNKYSSNQDCDPNKRGNLESKEQNFGEYLE